MLYRTVPAPGSEGTDLTRVECERALGRSRVERALGRWSDAQPLAQPLEVSTTGWLISSSESHGLKHVTLRHVARDT